MLFSGRIRNVRLLTPALSSFEDERENYFCWTLTQGCASFHVACPGLFSFARSGLRFVSLVQEQFPLGDAVGVAEVGRHRQLLRRARHGEQLQTSFVRQ